jgi:hypothetical protein
MGDDATPGGEIEGDDAADAVSVGDADEDGDG